MEEVQVAGREHQGVLLDPEPFGQELGVARVVMPRRVQCGLVERRGDDAVHRTGPGEVARGHDETVRARTRVRVDFAGRDVRQRGPGLDHLEGRRVVPRLRRLADHPDRPRLEARDPRP